MRHLITFTKVSGAGNDFVLVDNMSGTLRLNWADVARSVCSRPFGVGADGLLLLEGSERSAFAMRYYNADGSSGGMCGNGGRCAARYAFEHGYSPRDCEFEALDDLYHASVRQEGVTLRMKDISEPGRKMIFDPGGTRQCEGLFVNTGSPHVVFRVSHVGDHDVAGIGGRIRRDRLLHPDGANVNFVQYLDNNRLALRTYERGVEAETMACGTGAVAAAIAGWLEMNMGPPIQIRTRSGETLTVGFEADGPGVRNVTLEGSAHLLFTGSTLFDDQTSSIHVATEVAATQVR